jgi:hypothetical protein
MIQCSTSGTFDLELCVLTHPGEQSFALSTSAIFQHLQCLFDVCRQRPLWAGQAMNLQTGSICKLEGRHSKKPGACTPGFSVMRSFAFLQILCSRRKLTVRRYWRGTSPFKLFFRPRSLPAG